MEIGKNRASNPLESQKHPFSAFPTPWKVKNTQFLRFQPLGKTKSLIFCFSNPLESQKHSISAFPTPWKDKITHFLLFQPLGKTKMPRKPPVVGRRNAENNENGLSSADDR